MTKQFFRTLFLSYFGKAHCWVCVNQLCFIVSSGPFVNKTARDWSIYEAALSIGVEKILLSKKLFLSHLFGMKRRLRMTSLTCCAEWRPRRRRPSDTSPADESRVGRYGKRISVCARAKRESAPGKLLPVEPSASWTWDQNTRRRPTRNTTANLLLLFSHLVFYSN